MSLFSRIEPSRNDMYNVDSAPILPAVIACEAAERGQTRATE